MIGLALWIFALAPSVHRWLAPVSLLRLQAQVQGVVCILEAGDRLEIVGDTVEFRPRADTLEVRLRHRVQSWLARWGWALDTLVIRVPREVPVALDLRQQGGLLVLQAQDLRFEKIQGHLSRVRALVNLQGAERVARVRLQAGWSRLQIQPEPLHPPEYLEIQIQWSRLTLDLRHPPAHETPVVLAAQFSWIQFQTNGAPVAAVRQGLLNLGPLPQDPRNPGYRILLSGNFNRISVVSGTTAKEVHP